jgi:hypothetical protein
MLRAADHLCTEVTLRQRPEFIRAISRSFRDAATWLVLAGAGLGCGSKRPLVSAPPPDEPTAARVLPLNRAIVLESAGPQPGDTSVTFLAGTPRVIVLRHGAPENIVFARVSFAASSFPDSGQTVTVEVKPRPRIYGVDIAMSKPIRGGATLTFEYARYFSAPARARQVYRSDGAFERALTVGHILSEGQIELLPSVRPELDHVSAPIATSGSYLVAAPQ